MKREKVVFVRRGWKKKIPLLIFSLSFIFYVPIKFLPLIKIRNFLRPRQQFSEWMKELFSCEKQNQMELVKFFSLDIDCQREKKNYCWMSQLMFSIFLPIIGADEREERVSAHDIDKKILYFNLFWNSMLAIKRFSLMRDESII